MSQGTTLQLAGGSVAALSEPFLCLQSQWMTYGKMPLLSISVL